MSASQKGELFSEYCAFLDEQAALITDEDAAEQPSSTGIRPGSPSSSPTASDSASPSAATRQGSALAKALKQRAVRAIPSFNEWLEQRTASRQAEAARRAEEFRANLLDTLAVKFAPRAIDSVDAVGLMRDEVAAVLADHNNDYWEVGTRACICVVSACECN